MIYKLTYESNARLATSAVIADILTGARKKNVSLNITGCLVYHNGSFVQILEGRKEHVYPLYQTIKKDNRHSKVRLVSEEFDDKRNFTEWNMAYFDPTVDGFKESDLKNFERNVQLLTEFSDRSSTTTNLFWLNVRKIILDLKIA